MTSTARGTVAVWQAEEGWGVLETDATPGGCWAHYSAVDGRGLRELEPGEQVSVTFEAAQRDGYSWRAVHVLVDGIPPGRPAPSSPPGPAYTSSLDITWDDDPHP